MPTNAERLRHILKVGQNEYLSSGLQVDPNTPAWTPESILGLERHVVESEGLLGSGTHIISWGDDAPTPDCVWSIAIVIDGHVYAMLTGWFIESDLHHSLTLIMRQGHGERTEGELVQLTSVAESAVEASLALFTGDPILTD